MNNGPTCPNRSLVLKRMNRAAQPPRQGADRGYCPGGTTQAWRLVAGTVTTWECPAATRLLNPAGPRARIPIRGLLDGSGFMTSRDSAGVLEPRLPELAHRGRIRGW